MLDSVCIKRYVKAIEIRIKEQVTKYSEGKKMADLGDKKMQKETFGYPTLHSQLRLRLGRAKLVGRTIIRRLSEIGTERSTYSSNTSLNGNKYRCIWVPSL